MWKNFFKVHESLISRACRAKQWEAVWFSANFLFLEFGFNDDKIKEKFWEAKSIWFKLPYFSFGSEIEFGNKIESSSKKHFNDFNETQFWVTKLEKVSKLKLKYETKTIVI